MWEKCIIVLQNSFFSGGFEIPTTISKNRFIPSGGKSEVYQAVGIQKNKCHDQFSVLSFPFFWKSFDYKHLHRICVFFK